MRTVLLSGGSGKRLWPLSNDTRSKQFLKVLEDNDGNYESMVQRVWRQISKSNITKEIIVTTSKSQYEILKAQLGDDLTVISEPSRRDTFPAIALSAAYLYSEKKIELDEVISVLPVDPFVEDDFFLKLSDIEGLLKNNSKFNIGLMGVRPSEPSEKFGYIAVQDEVAAGYYLVDSFVEKPNEKIAEELIKNNSLWNCGVFCFRLGFLIEWLRDNKFPTDFNELLDKYNELPQTSFDYEILEKIDNIVVMPFEGTWKDLGTWDSLTSEMTLAVKGKGQCFGSSKNTNIINELGIPVISVDISDTVIAASPDGILVSSKDSSAKIKNYIKDFNDIPMYEERRWGWYKVLDFTKYDDGKEVLTKRIGINKDKNLSYHKHLMRSETWTLIKGEGILIIDGLINHVRPGDVINIKLGIKHAIKAISDLEIIEVQSGMDLSEEDIYREATKWNEILEKLYIKSI